MHDDQTIIELKKRNFELELAIKALIAVASKIDSFPNDALTSATKTVGHIANPISKEICDILAQIVDECDTPHCEYGNDCFARSVDFKHLLDKASKILKDVGIVT